MSKRFNLLNSGTRTHLYNLITDVSYRKQVDSASYDFAPKADGQMGVPRGRKTVRKYGFTRSLPAGTASREKMRGRDPGKFRVVQVTEGGRISWWIGEHAPGNTYKFHKVTGVPRCPDCKGTNSQICPDCSGTATKEVRSGRTNNFIEKSKCKTCRGSGFRKCPSCDENILFDGYTVILDIDKWV